MMAADGAGRLGHPDRRLLRRLVGRSPRGRAAGQGDARPGREVGQSENKVGAPMGEYEAGWSVEKTKLMGSTP